MIHIVARVSLLEWKQCCDRRRLCVQHTHVCVVDLLMGADDILELCVYLECFSVNASSCPSG